MPMTMREKMARAMAQADGVPVALSEMPTAALSRYVAMADAALSALAEPTEAMVEAGERERGEGGSAYYIFCAMIDKAGE